MIYEQNHIYNMVKICTKGKDCVVYYFMVQELPAKFCYRFTCSIVKRLQLHDLYK